jgi:hypothetical protein
VAAGASQSMSMALTQSLVRSMRTASGRHPEGLLRRLLGVFKAFSVKVDPTGAVAVGVEVDPIRGVADSGRFADDLAALFEVLGETARELGVGVLILVDELQEATSEELAAINTAVHHLGQASAPLPLTFVGAGLPSLPAQLAEATTYAERLHDYRSVGLLDERASRDALVVPAQERGVEWDRDDSPRLCTLLVVTRTSCNRSANTCGTSPVRPRSARPTSTWDSPTPAERSTMACTAPDGSEPPLLSATCCGCWPGSGGMTLPRSPTSPRLWANHARRTYPSPATS